MKFHKILLFINLFLLQCYLIRFKIFTYPSNLQEILIFTQILSFFYVTPFKKILEGLRRHMIIMAFIALTGFSLLTTDILNQLDLIRQLKFLFFAATLAFIFLETFQENDERKQAVKIMGIGAIVFGLFSVLYNLLGHNVAPDSRLLGPLDAAVYLAYFLTPFFIFFMIESLENSQKKSNILCAVLLGLLIIATRSIGAIGGSLAVILLYLFKRSDLQILKKKSTKVVAVTMILLATATTFYTKILPAINTNYSSFDERGEIWITSLDLLKNPKNIIFGLGYGQFQENYFQNVETVLGKKPLDFYVLQPHNIFLLFIFQYGILGLIFLFYLILKNIQNIAKFKTQLQLNDTANFILLYFFLHGLIDTPWFKNDLLFLFITFATISLPKKVTGNEQSREIIYSTDDIKKTAK